MIPDNLIEILLKRTESPTLEFKSEWYKIDSDNPKTVETQKAELIKDILSLANGNANVTGETAYLIIGASDKLNEQGEHEIFDVTQIERISSDRILKIVNSVCSPPLDNLLCDVVSIGEKKIVVITILPSPYLHELQMKIQTPKRSFDEYTVFVRQGEKISTASTKERIAIEQLKMLRYQEGQNVPPVRFGIGIGATIGGILVPGLAEKALKTKSSRKAGLIVGILLGGFFGGALGNILKDLREIQRNWKYTPIRAKVFGIFAGAMISSVFLLISNSLRKSKVT